MNASLKNILPQDRVFLFAVIVSLIVHTFLLFDFSFRIPDIKNPKLVYIPQKKQTKPRPLYVPASDAPKFKDKRDLPDYAPKNVEIGLGKTKINPGLPPEKKISKLAPNERLLEGRLNRPVKDISDNVFKQMINIRDVPPDPSIRAYYLNYYQSIRLRIRQIAYRKYRQTMPPGDVFLAFSLDREGNLLSAFVDRDRSSADYDLCELALDSLRAAAPFEPFPKELIQEELSFNVIVSFRRK